MTDLISREAVLEILREQRDAAIETSDTHGDDTAFGEDEDHVYADNLDYLMDRVRELPNA